MKSTHMKQGLCALAIAVSFAFAGSALAEKPADAGEKPAKKMKGERPEKADKGERPEKGERGAKGELRGHLGEMNKIVGLSDDQVQQIHAIGKSHHEARKSWMEANGEKMKALKEKMQAAESKEEKAALHEQMKSLTEEIRQAEENHRSQVMGVLTAEQATKWVTHQLSQQVDRKTSKLNLTPEQKTKVEAIVQDVAASNHLGASTDYKQLQEAVRAVWQRMASEVLTEDQKSRLKGSRGDKGDKPGHEHKKGEGPMKDKKGGKASKADKE